MSITIDGTAHKANWVVKSLKRKAEIINGDASGRMQGTKAMYLDYVGTFYNYTGQLRRTADCTDAEWENLFTVLTSPINNHTITVPYGDSTMTAEFYISSVENTLITQEKGANEWERVYSVTFTSMSAERLASAPNTIIGVS